VFRTAVQPIYTASLNQALLAALSARPALALLATPNVHLFVNNLAVAWNTVIGDLTEATFAGYAAIALPAFSAPVHLASNGQGLVASINFVGGAIVAPGQVAYGYYLTDTTNAILYWLETFAEPVPFASVGDFLNLDIVAVEPAGRAA
jgi:hypothetical protein